MTAADLIEILVGTVIGMTIGIGIRMFVIKKLFDYL